MYCPYCGDKLEKASGNKNLLTRELGISDSIKAFIVWLLLFGIFVVLYTVFKQLFSSIIGIEIPGLFTWIIIAILAGVGVYFTFAYVVYNHAKKHNRRAVAWATAFIAFSPILAGLLYLLTWPKR